MSLRNPTYGELAQAAHILLGYAVMLTAMTFGSAVLWFTALIFIALTAIKEFWFDLKYEHPEVSGGFHGGLEDFGFYMLGMVTGLFVIWLR